MIRPAEQAVYRTYLDEEDLWQVIAQVRSGHLSAARISRRPGEISVVRQLGRDSSLEQDLPMIICWPRPDIPWEIIKESYRSLSSL